MKPEDFIVGGQRHENEVVDFHGIPFSVSRKDGVIQTLGLNNPSIDPGINGSTCEVEINQTCEMLFFLGMVTEKPEGSEWWGQSERYHYHGTRVFIGDRVGRIKIFYADDTMETIPVIFGVNVWNYELFTPLKENEKHLNNYYWGPYNEPFNSDSNAAGLLKKSLVLMENDSEKAMKYIMALTVKAKPLAKVSFHKEPYREAGFVVSSVTALRKGAAVEKDWKIVEPDYFLRHEYFTCMDRLARRLYQFRDDMPASVKMDTIERYSGPKVRFAGNGTADIFSNVYLHNYHDMATCKIDTDGVPHTSSLWAPNFGCYVGFGTYREKLGVYYRHIWSRDIARVLMELAETGESIRVKKAAGVLQRYLYDECIKYKMPHWKRIANTAEQDEGTRKFVAGRENDGHSAMMMFMHSAYHHGIVDTVWLEENRNALYDAVSWIEWQIDNPDQSNFDKVLYSESEASTQVNGGYDLFSNICSYYGLKGYEKLAEAIQDTKLMGKCGRCASTLRQGLLERFTTLHPRYGRIFTDTIDDCWTWEYKRFSPLFLIPDIYSYEPSLFDDELYQICRNTYFSQKEEYFSPAAGRQMGYGQGFLTETCILLDEYKDMTGCIEQAAMFCYHHTDYNYIVPEGVVMHPSGRFWFRNADLGNAVQQAEIIKCARLLIGLDDNNPENGLDIIPRLPDSWNSIEVADYIITAASGGVRKLVPVKMQYIKTGNTYQFTLSVPEAIKVGILRFGPFDAGVKRFNISEKHEYREVERAGRKFVYMYMNSEVDHLNILIKAE